MQNNKPNSEEHVAALVVRMFFMRRYRCLLRACGKLVQQYKIQQMVDYYDFIVTFTISDDNLRNELVGKLTDAKNGYNAESIDQSTYGIKNHNDTPVGNFKESIEKHLSIFCENKKLYFEKGDFVNVIYSQYREDHKAPQETRLKMKKVDVSLLHHPI